MTQPIPIQLIAVDIDGTLLNSQHMMPERVEKALKAAIDQGVQVVLATGKNHHSGAHLVEKLGISAPGIYTQGTVTFNADGSIRHQHTLDPRIARQVITFAEDRGYAIALYSGKRILVRSMVKRIEELSTIYHETLPEAIGPLQNVLDGVPVNKILIVKDGDGRAITALRWQLGMQISSGARLVQAGIADMLEILPPGASKGAALKALLKDLGIPAANVMAMGDAENDIEMIRLAGIGVAVGNAGQAVKDAADFVVASNDEDGVAEAVERFVLRTPAAETVEPQPAGS